jgi:erythronate-4-phosphate dehydrogenase
VYQNEPNPDQSYIEAVDFCTPHIAGHSFTAKRRGTEMAARAIFNQLNIPFSLPLTETGHRILQWDGSLTAEQFFTASLKSAYSIEDDFERGAILRSKPTEHFDHLRKVYPVRHECCDFTIQDMTGLGVPQHLKLILETFGFSIE